MLGPPLSSPSSLSCSKNQKSGFHPTQIWELPHQEIEHPLDLHSISPIFFSPLLLPPLSFDLMSVSSFNTCVCFPIKKKKKKKNKSSLSSIIG